MLHVLYTFWLNQHIVGGGGVYDIKQQKLERVGWVQFALALLNSFDEVP